MYFAHCELAFSMLTAWSEVTQGNRISLQSSQHFFCRNEMEKTKNCGFRSLSRIPNKLHWLPVHIQRPMYPCTYMCTHTHTCTYISIYYRNPVTQSPSQDLISGACAHTCAGASPHSHACRSLICDDTGLVNNPSPASQATLLSSHCACLLDIQVTSLSQVLGWWSRVILTYRFRNITLGNCMTSYNICVMGWRGRKHKKKC